MVLRWLWFFIVFLGLVNPVFGESFSSKVQKPVKKSIIIRQNIQKERDAWHKEYLTLKRQYESLKDDVFELEEKNKSLEANIKNISISIKRYSDEIEKLDNISERMLPFLDIVYERLKEFINKDIPFLSEERRARLKTIDRVLKDPQFSLGEKFRKLIEALFIEAEYGNTIEVYQDRIHINGKLIEGNVFRLGRVALFFQSPDKRITAVFVPSTSSWKELPRKYAGVICAAIDMAAKRRPVELLTLPIGRIQISK